MAAGAPACACPDVSCVVWRFFPFIVEVWLPSFPRDALGPSPRISEYAEIKKQGQLVDDRAVVEMVLEKMMDEKYTYVACRWGSRALSPGMRISTVALAVVGWVSYATMVLQGGWWSRGRWLSANHGAGSHHQAAV